MRIAELFRKSPQKLQVAAGVLFAAVISYVLYHAAVPKASFTSKAFFTVDDGASQFVDSADKLAPFDHGGKPAYRVVMFSTDGGKTKFPAYLQRYTPDGRARIEAAMADLKAGKIKVAPPPDPRDTEVKLPGAENPWVNGSDRAALRIENAKVPPTTDTEFEIVFPS